MKFHAIAASRACLVMMVMGMQIGSRAADSSELRIKVGVKAPNFDLAAPDGRRVKLSDFAGRNVLIDFYRGYW
jgi:cytochrome oxidase Cu insertion factor (SCO1/SenC/PrrC family)